MARWLAVAIGSIAGLLYVLASLVVTIFIMLTPKSHWGAAWLVPTFLAVYAVLSFFGVGKVISRDTDALLYQLVGALVVTVSFPISWLVISPPPPITDARLAFEALRDYVVLVAPFLIAAGLVALDRRMAHALRTTVEKD